MSSVSSSSGLSDSASFHTPYQTQQEQQSSKFLERFSSSSDSGSGSPLLQIAHSIDRNISLGSSDSSDLDIASIQPLFLPSPSSSSPSSLRRRGFPLLKKQVEEEEVDNWTRFTRWCTSFFKSDATVSQNDSLPSSQSLSLPSASGNISRVKTKYIKEEVDNWTRLSRWFANLFKSNVGVPQASSINLTPSIEPFSSRVTRAQGGEVGYKARINAIKRKSQANIAQLEKDKAHCLARLKRRGKGKTKARRRGVYSWQVNIINKRIQRERGNANAEIKKIMNDVLSNFEQQRLSAHQYACEILGDEWRCGSRGPRSSQVSPRVGRSPGRSGRRPRRRRYRHRRDSTRMMKHNIERRDMNEHAAILSRCETQYITQNRRHRPISLSGPSSED